MTQTALIPLTKKTVDELIGLLPLMEFAGIWSIHTTSAGRAIFLRNLSDAIAVLGITPTFEQSAAFEHFRWEAVYSGVRVHGVVTVVELPSIGYHLVDGKPVPIQSATA